MSRTPLENLFSDLRRWKFDVERSGHRFTATLLGGDPIVFHREDTNAQIRATHEQAAIQAKQPLPTVATGKRANRSHHVEVQRAKHSNAQQDARVVQQFRARNHETVEKAALERHRRELERRWFELQDLQRMMTH